MPETASFSFDIVQLTISKEESLLFSLLIPDTIRFNTQKKEFANEFIQAINKRFIKNGEYLEVLKLLPSPDLKEKSLNVPIDKDKGGILYPDLNLEFQIFYLKINENKYIGFVPVLGIESYGETEKQLEKNLVENIKLEFARKKRLVAVDLILTTLWFNNIKSISQPVEIGFYSLNELEQINSGEKKQYLPTVSELIKTDNESETFGLNYEKKQLSKALQGKYMRSILLVGPSGIGKTSLIYDICHKKSTYGFSSEKFRETTATQLIQKLTDGDGWQQNLSKVCNELRKDNNILFIRSFADMFEAGQYEGNNISLAEYLRKYIERGEIIIITECTDEEASLIDILSPGYLSLFHIIHFEEAATKDIGDIINRKVKVIAEKNNVSINENAIKEIVQLQQRYTPYSGFPGKTIRFLESVILNQKQKKTVIDRKLAIQYFCEETGLPDFMINQEIPLDIEKIENFFQSNIFGQEIAIETIVNLLTAVKTSLNRSGKPIASLLFVGPTGVGKTEMAKILAQFMFGNRQKMIRFDMSEYSNPDAVLRLTGSGFFSEGILTSKVRQEPFSVVLFDELEKAHYSFFDLLLQILGEGRLTDSKGKITDFCSTIIIMTSNIGAKSYQKSTFGFVHNQNIKEEAKKHFMKEVQNFFRPELFNRLDQVLPFLPLDKITVRNIVQREIDLISKREGIKHRNTTFEITDNALDYLCNKGYDAYYGARQMQRTLREEFLIPLSPKLNKYRIDVPLTSKVDVFNDKLNIVVKAVSTEQNFPVISADEKPLIFRRESQMMEEGEYFIKLLSELDILEHKKRRLKNDFWKDMLDSEKYSNLVKLKDIFSGIVKTIKELETKAFIQQSGIEDIIIDFPESINKWETDYIRTKIELYQLLTSKADICTFGIYGSPEHLQELLRIYQNIGEEKKYESKLKSVWLRNTEYFKYDKLTPEKENDRLLGLEIEFYGKAPFLYFKGENGVHSFKKDRKDTESVKYHVQVYNCNLENFPTPENIHRQIFYYELKEQRTYAPDYFKDTFYKVEQNSSNYQQTIKEILDVNFSNNLTNILINGEE